MHNTQPDIADRASVFEPDALLPSQYFDRLRGTDRSGEWRLVVAILEDAVNVYRNYAGTTDAHKRGLFDDAEEWIESGDREWFLSFENVCDILGLDAGYLRRGLRAWKARAGRRPSRATAPAIEVATEPGAFRKASGE